MTWMDTNELKERKSDKLTHNKSRQWMVEPPKCKTVMKFPFCVGSHTNNFRERERELGLLGMSMVQRLMHIQILPERERESITMRFNRL